ncbi:MAG: glycoside hydrolase family 16 protein [Anaerolineae bacterium]|nr:glycoside hydrolase family 16 protein [Anaerolineae bacterium]
MRFARLMTLALAALGLTMTLPAAAQEPSGAEATPETAAEIETPEGWALVWHDEFDGEAIDESSWTYDLGAGGWGNGEAQHYTDRPENARIEDGMLVIEARQERYMGSYYTSARLKTEGLREFQYGRIEARVRVPAGRGLWPAFWMLGSNIREVGWPDCGEIDIMEYIGREPDLILGTIHGPGYSGALGLSKWNRQEYDIADDFHTYAVEWDENQITWFYDGVEYSTYTRADVGERDWPFDQPFFIILNLALGGQFPGPIGLDVVFPTQYVVDYVRVFQSESA